MPSHDDDAHETNSAQHNYLKPLHSDGSVISFNGNDACIPGAMHAFGLWVRYTEGQLIAR